MGKKQISIETLYGQYKRLFRAEKKIHNIKNGVFMASKKKFMSYLKNPNSDSVKKILDMQRKVAQDDKKKVWRDYLKRVRSNLHPGDSTIQDNTYWGENWDDDEGLKYHRTLSGLLGDGNSLHFLIAQRLAGGEDKYAVLADFGYNEE